MTLVRGTGRLPGAAPTRVPNRFRLRDWHGPESKEHPRRPRLGVARPSCPPDSRKVDSMSVNTIRAKSAIRAWALAAGLARLVLQAQAGSGLGKPDKSKIGKGEDYNPSTIPRTSRTRTATHS